MIEPMERAKQKIGELSDRFSAFLVALGGKIDGFSPLPAGQAAALRRRAAYCTAFVILGFLFSGTSSFFDSQPYAVALLMCATHSNTVFVWMGAVAGTLVGGHLVLAKIVILTLLFFVRYCLSGGSFWEKETEAFGEGLSPRLILSAIAALLLGIVECIAYEPTGKRILATLFNLILTPLFCAAFRAAFDKTYPKTLHEAGIYCLLYVLISSLSGNSLLGFSFALIASFLLLLYTGLQAGMLRGAIMGLICGIGCGDYGVILAISGLSVGAFAPFGVGTAVFAGLALAVGIGFYSSGLTTSMIGFTGDAIFAGLIYLPLSKAGFLNKIKLFSFVPSAEESIWPLDPASEKKREELRLQKLSLLSKAFDEISLLLLKLSEELRNPADGSIQALCDEVFDKCCYRCALSSFCWQKDYEQASQTLLELASAIREKGVLRYEDLPEFLKKRCRHAERLMRELNKGYADRLESAITKDKTELFALDYAAIARLLRENEENLQGGKQDGRYLPDTVLQANAVRVFRYLGIFCSSVAAFGTRQKEVVASGVEVGSVTVSAKQIAKALREETKLDFLEPTFKFEGDFVTMTLTTGQKYRVVSASACQQRKGESVSGDRVKTFSGLDGMTYALICDGMGSGREAATVAEISTVFLEKMLSAGNSRKLSLQLLSNLLCARAAECSCTIDLLEIDLLTGEAVFSKCGSAPSYVFRRGKIFKVDSESLPIGVVKELSCEDTHLNLESGDLLVLTSDGVGNGLEQAAWLPELVVNREKRSPLGESPAELADLICQRAVAENHGSDDMSVIVVRLEKI
jgi:stage II sporulation protein E